MNGIGGDLFAHRLRREDEDRARPQRERPRRGRRHARGVPAAGSSTRSPIAACSPSACRASSTDGSELLAKHGTITLDARAPAGHRLRARRVRRQRDHRGRSGRPSRRRWRSDPAAAATFLPGGRAPQPGDVFKNPHLAATLELDRARRTRRVLQAGRSPRRSPPTCGRADGLLTAADLAANIPTGSDRSRRPTAATTCSSSRRTRRASSRSRC